MFQAKRKSPTGERSRRFVAVPETLEARRMLSAAIAGGMFTDHLHSPGGDWSGASPQSLAAYDFNQQNSVDSLQQQAGDPQVDASAADGASGANAYVSSNSDGTWGSNGQSASSAGSSSNLSGHSYNSDSYSYPDSQNSSNSNAGSNTYSGSLADGGDRWNGASFGANSVSTTPIATAPSTSWNATQDDGGSHISDSDSSAENDTFTYTASSDDQRSHDGVDWSVSSSTSSVSVVVPSATVTTPTIDTVPTAITIPSVLKLPTVALPPIVSTSTSVSVSVSTAASSSTVTTTISTSVNTDTSEVTETTTVVCVVPTPGGIAADIAADVPSAAPAAVTNPAISSSSNTTFANSTPPTLHPASEISGTGLSPFDLHASAQAANQTAGSVPAPVSTPTTSSTSTVTSQPAVAAQATPILTGAAVFNQTPIHSETAQAVNAVALVRLDGQAIPEPAAGPATSTAAKWVNAADGALASWMSGNAASSIASWINLAQATSMAAQSPGASSSASLVPAAKALSRTIIAPMVALPATIVYRFANFDPAATFADAMAEFAHESASLTDVSVQDAPRHSSHRAWIITGAVVAVDGLLLANWYVNRMNEKRKKQQSKKSNAHDAQSPQAGFLPTGL